MGGFLTNAFLMTVLSGSMVLYFGSHTSAISTLNWKNYTAGQEKAPLWASFVSWMVVMMPVITISAGYPIQSASLANNLLNGISVSSWHAIIYPFGLPNDVVEHQPLSTESGHSSSLGNPTWPTTRAKVVARLASVLPPLIPCLFVKDASKIIRVGGLVGFLISLLIPCILQLASMRVFGRLWPHAPNPSYTPYSGFYSRYPAIAVVLCLSCVAFAYSTYDTVRRLAQG
uniref:Amino acid transporter transmembrane domain-containing protein n=1 Tax=Eutreptiella gymnastica TaxID=73025 RepID=A0A7S1NBA8_9EUGL